MVIDPPKSSMTVKINYTENPRCTKDFIEEAEECKRKRPDDYAHIYMGEPKGLGSKVYPAFIRTHHVIDINMSRIENVCNVFMGQDPHTVYFPFCVWIARVPKSDEEFDYIIYNEFPTFEMMGNKYYYEIRQEKSCGLTLKQRANMYRVLDNTIEKTYNGIKSSDVKRALDTRFAKAAGAPSETLDTKGIIVAMSDPQNGGMTFETPPESSIDSQRDRLRELLEYNTDLPVNEFNCPHLFVKPHCKNVIVSLENHRDDLLKNREDAKYKDPIDALKIALALAQSCPHKDRTIKVAPVEQPDTIKDLREVYLEHANIYQGDER
jgi:hypothetical protein